MCRRSLLPVPLSAGYAAPSLDLPDAVQSHESRLNEEKPEYVRPDACIASTMRTTIFFYLIAPAQISDVKSKAIAASRLRRRVPAPIN